MKTEAEIKELVRQKYSEIALQDKATNESSCCGAGACSAEWQLQAGCYPVDRADDAGVVYVGRHEEPLGLQR